MVVDITVDMIRRDATADISTMDVRNSSSTYQEYSMAGAVLKYVSTHSMTMGLYMKPKLLTRKKKLMMKVTDKIIFSTSFCMYSP